MALSNEIKTDPRWRTTMPLAMILAKWTDLDGPKSIATCPPNSRIDDATLNQIFDNHRAYTLKPGFAFLSTGKYRILSYYSGSSMDPTGQQSKADYVLALFLNRNEDASVYRIPLRTAVTKVFGAIGKNEEESVITSAFRMLPR